MHSPRIFVPGLLLADQMRLPYWAEIALDKLAAGQYVLQVIATDRRTNATAIQQASFTVD